VETWVRAPGAAKQTLTISDVTPQTGALAAFGEADAFVVDQVTASPLGTGAIAGVCSGVRTTFDPATGSTVLICAFDASERGGPGSGG
jgi:hypothetical protein